MNLFPIFHRHSYVRQGKVRLHSYTDYLVFGVCVFRIESEL